MLVVPERRAKASINRTQSDGEIIMKIYVTAQITKFTIKGFFSKCDQIRSFSRIWSHLPNTFLMENFILCAAYLSAAVRKEIQIIHSFCR